MTELERVRRRLMAGVDAHLAAFETGLCSGEGADPEVLAGFAASARAAAEAFIDRLLEDLKREPQLLALFAGYAAETEPN